MHDELSPTGATLPPIVWRPRRRVTAQAVAASVVEVLRCHGILRGYISVCGDQLVQIERPASVSEQFVSGASLTQAVEATTEVLRCTDRLFAGKVASEPSGSAWAVLLLNHVAVDDQSAATVCADLDAALDGRLGQPSLVYADYAREELAWRETAAADDQRAFWRWYLAGCPIGGPVSSFADPRAGFCASGGELLFTIGTELMSRLDTCARSFQTTRFTVLLAAWCAALISAGEHSEIAVAITVANRSSRYKHVVGPMSKSVLVRAGAGAQTWRERVGAFHRDLTQIRFSSGSRGWMRALI
ncbi:MAG: condensation domain-containing protein [Candidatus Dormibacteria bacterium]